MLHAAKNGHLPVVEYLLEKGAEIEAKNDVSGVNDVIDLKPHKRHACIFVYECIRKDPLR